MRLSDVARVELGAEEPDMVAKYGEKEGVYLGVWPLVGVNEIDVAHDLRAEMERIRPTLPKDIDMRLVYDGTRFMEDALTEITKTLAETICIVGLVVFLFMGSVRSALVPLVAMPLSLVGAAIVMYALGFSLNLLTILAIVLSVGLVVDDAIVVVENVERHVREGRTADRRRAGRRARAGGADHRHDDHPGDGLHPDRVSGRPHRVAVPRVRDHAGGGGRGVGRRRGHPVARDELQVRPRAGEEGRLTRLVNRAFEAVRGRYAWLLDAALQMRGGIVAAALLVMAAAWPLYSFSPPELAPVEDQGHISFFMEAAPGRVAAGVRPRLAGRHPAGAGISRGRASCGRSRPVGRVRRHGHEGLEGALALDRADVRRGVRRGVAGARACRCFPGSIRRCPTPGQYDVELVLAERRAARAAARRRSGR